MVEDKALNTDTMELLSKHENLWSGRSGTNKATRHRICMNKGTPPIRQQSYCAGQRSREVLREHIDKHQEAGLIKPAHSEWIRPIEPVAKNE